MNHTTNYQLSQWAKSDQVKMEDFNADNAKIDGALKAGADARTALAAQVAKLGNCQIYPFTYTGTGGAQTLTFPHKPLLVLIVDGSGCAAVCVYGAWASRSLDNKSSSFVLTWGENSLSWNGYDMNYNDVTYRAIAFFSME